MNIFNLAFVATAMATPTRFGMVVFPGFQALDVYGPLDTLNMLAFQKPINLSIIASTLQPVSTRPMAMNVSFGESIVPTHTFADKPDVEVLLLPGGVGTRAPDLGEVFDYIKDTYPRLQYLITVCTGASLAAGAGVLDGKNATTNKRAWSWVTSTGPKTNWIAKARWVEDGNVWSTSGVSAGIDGTLAWIGKVYGESIADDISQQIEHVRVIDPTQDPFAALNNATDVPPRE